MRRLLISSAIGLGVLFGALAPAFVPTSASAYYYHHRYYHHRYYPHGTTATGPTTGITITRNTGPITGITTMGTIDPTTTGTIIMGTIAPTGATTIIIGVAGIS